MNSNISLVKQLYGFFSICVLICLIFSSPAQGNDDPILAAIQAEVKRTMKELKLPGSPRPYFASCSLNYSKNVNANAVSGSTIETINAKEATIAVSIRVGDYKLDNTNFIPKFSFGGESELDVGMPIPIDGDSTIIRRAIWWAMDSAYKKAVENFERKKSILKSLSIPPVANDFAEAPVMSYSSDTKPINLPSTQSLKSQAELFSSILKEKRDLRETKVQVGANISERWYVNSEGTKIHTLQNLAYIEISVEAQCDDGVIVGDEIFFVAQSPEKLPHFSQVKQEINKLGDRVQMMKEAPLLDDFIGPVLFEGEASVELASRVLANSFLSQRKPISEGDDWFGKKSKKSSIRRKLGRRVMATNFNIIDDPTVDSFEGQYLCGNRAIDFEGVKVQKVQLVENGILKTLLTTRTPDKKLPKSNGHALSESMLYEGAYKPATTNLFIEYQDGLKEDELKGRLMQAINDQGVDYGLIIRRISFKNIPDMEDMFNFFMNFRRGKSSIDDPIFAFRVFPDGHEEPVRIGSIKNIELSSYKDILAAGKKRYVRNVWKMGVLSSIVAPSILFEEIITEKPEADVYKPPLITSPLLSLQH